MNNQALQALIDELGERLCIIIFDNVSRIYVDYPSKKLSLSDIELVNKGGVDMIKVTRLPANERMVRNGVKYVLYYPTECVQCVVAVDEDHPNVRVDPFEIS